jgi:hypothetical protein
MSSCDANAGISDGNFYMIFAGFLIVLDVGLDGD